jgi:hypothetical protein
VPDLAARRRASVQAYRDLAEQRRRVQDEAARERAVRHAAFMAQVERPTEPPVASEAYRAARAAEGALADATGAAAAAAAAEAPAARTRLRILAEGDSWFEYPLPPFSGDGVIVQLEKLLSHKIDNDAHHGDEVRQMLAVTQRRQIVARLSDPGIRYDAMLFSGGGNDCVGEQFILWLREADPQPPENLLDPDASAAILRLIEEGYRDLVRLRDDHSADTVLFLHGYDFPPITGKPAPCNVGPWLRPALDYQYRDVLKIDPDPHAQFRIVKAFLEQFNAALNRVADWANARRPDSVVVVQTQGTLTANDTHWQNELHPSTAGFKLVARKFKEALDRRFATT